MLLPRVVATYRERGFSRIAELDRKLEDAEMKYLESQRSLRQLQAELATPHDPRWDSLTSELGSYGKYALYYRAQLPWRQRMLSVECML